MLGFLRDIKGDKVIWGTSIFLMCVSIMAVYSATSSLSLKESGNISEYFLGVQVFYVLVGLLVMFILHKMNYNWFSGISVYALIFSIFLLIFTLAFGKEINGAKRWIELPFIDITFQSSDVAKLSLFMFLAAALSNNIKKRIDLKYSFITMSGAICIICALIFPEDFSTTFTIFVTSMALLFIGQIPIAKIGKFIGITVAGAVLIVSLMSAVSGFEGRTGVMKNRIVNFIDGNERFQAEQAKAAIAYGGLQGVGPGKSRQKDIIPQSFSDFMYSIIIEEWGFLGGLVLIIAYLLILYRAIQIFKRHPGVFGALLAVGLAIQLVIQAMIHMAVNVGLFPVTGINLPIVSKGGTSLVFTCISIGIILSVSKYIDQKDKEEQNKKVKYDLVV